MRSAILRRHFFRQFLDNDLLSPDADRHEALSTVSAAVVAGGLFISVFISLKYLFRPFQSPAWTEVAVLDDVCLFSAWSMLLMALLAVIEWDALGLDARDTANLGLLPVRRRDLARAKLGAVVLFALAFDAILNGIPSVLQPLLMTVKLDVGLTGVAVLIAAHAVTTSAAGLFGFAAVVGVRELLHALVRGTAFAPVARVAQAMLFTACATGFLLAPSASSRIADLAATQSGARFLPGVWFAGLHGVMAEPVFKRVPRVPLPKWPAEDERTAATTYGRARRTLRELAVVAVSALACACALAVTAYAWSTRRLQPPPPARRGLRADGGIRAIGRALLPRRGSARAGFMLTVKTLARSAPHRFAIAAAVALGLAAAAGCLRAGMAPPGGQGPAAPPSLLQIQTYFIVFLLLGVRHAISLPSDLAAGWVFQLAGTGNRRAYVRGIWRACLLAVFLPTVMALAPLHVWLFGWRVTSGHALVGLFLSAAGCAWVAHNVETPLVSPHEPSETLRTRFPVYVVAIAAGVYGFAWAERLAMTAAGLISD